MLVAIQQNISNVTEYNDYYYILLISWVIRSANSVKQRAPLRVTGALASVRLDCESNWRPGRLGKGQTPLFVYVVPGPLHAEVSFIF